jgi:hypothetical protein
VNQMGVSLNTPKTTTKAQAMSFEERKRNAEERFLSLTPAEREEVIAEEPWLFARGLLRIPDSLTAEYQLFQRRRENEQSTRNHRKELIELLR